MDKHPYHYYGVKDNEVWHLASRTRPSMMSWWTPKIISESDVVWCQGLRGGVRLVHYNWIKSDNAHEFKKFGYITTDPEAMKEFAWAKLRARNIN